MVNYDVRETNCVKFIEALQKVEANSLEFPTSLSKNLYKTSYNDFFKVSDFLRNLDELYKAFQYELQYLPLNCPSDNGRKVFLINLHLILLRTRSAVEEKFQAEVQPKFEYLYLDKDIVLEKFPDAYCPLIHDSEKGYEHHKIHFMYQSQYRTVNEAIDLVVVFANNEGIDVSSKLGEHPITSPERGPRTKTVLTLAQLAHFMNLVSEAIGDGAIPKSDLAAFISSSFETARSKKPSQRQVYKSFFEVEESTREVVKDLVIKMLNKARG